MPDTRLPVTVLSGFLGAGKAAVCTDNLNAGVAVMKSAQDGA
jgi:G3E family GTPase